MNEITKRPSKIQIASRWRAIDQLAADADRLAARYAELEALLPVLREHAAALETGRPLAGPLPDEGVAKLGTHDEALVQRCNEAIEALDPEENYDGDREGDLRRNVISIRLAMLCGSFPAGTPGDPEVYVQVLLEHIAAIESLSFVALDAACRQIATGQKFLPAISEVVAAIEEQQATWNDRYWAIWEIADRSRQIAADIAALRPAWEASAAARAEREARQNLDHALRLRGKAAAEATAAQERAATAAQEVGSKMALLERCEAHVSEAMQKLADAVAQLANSETPAP